MLMVLLLAGFAPVPFHTDPIPTMKNMAGDWEIIVCNKNGTIGYTYYYTLLKNGKCFCSTSPIHHYEGKWSIKGSIFYLAEKETGGRGPLVVWKNEKVRVVRGNGKKRPISALDGETILMRRVKEE